MATVWAKKKRKKTITIFIIFNFIKVYDYKFVFSVI